MKQWITCIVNGETVTREIEQDMTLLRFLNLKRRTSIINS